MSSRHRFSAPLSFSVLTVASVLALSGCGGGSGGSGGNQAGTQSTSPEQSHVMASGEASAQPSAVNPAATLVVRAHAQAAQGVFPDMVVRHNGLVIGRTTVQATQPQDHAFESTQEIRSGDTVDVAFTNDFYQPPEDRNLWVDSVQIGSTRLAATDSTVRYDLGAGDMAFDGQHLLPGRALLETSGALRFTVPQVGATRVALAQQVAYPGKLKNLLASPPIEVTQNDTIIENLHITNPNGPCILIKPGVRNVTIRNNEIGPCKDDGVRADNTSHVSVTHNHIHDTTDVVQDPEFRGTTTDGNGVQAHGANNITVSLNHMQSMTSGFVAHGENVEKIVFEKNMVRDVLQDISSLRSRGERRDHIPRIGGQALQIANMTNGAGTRVTCNISDQEARTASVGDHINFYASSGAPAAPILIAFNKLSGATAASSYGAGTQVGDAGGSHIHVYRNNYYNASVNAMSISGGQDITYEENKVFYSVDFHDKYPHFWATGLQVRKQDAGSYVCKGHKILRNRLDVVKPGWGGRAIVDAYELRDDPYHGSTDAGSWCPDTVYDGNVVAPDPQRLTRAALLDETFPECQ